MEYENKEKSDAIGVLPDGDGVHEMLFVTGCCN